MISIDIYEVLFVYVLTVAPLIRLSANFELDHRTSCPSATLVANILVYQGVDLHKRAYPNIPLRLVPAICGVYMVTTPIFSAMETVTTPQL